MPALYHDDIQLLSAEDVERIYRRTDALELHRDWVVVPLNCAATASEQVLPDGKVLIRAPGVAAFEPWIETLPARLMEMGLSRTPRRSVDDPSLRLPGVRRALPIPAAEEPTVDVVAPVVLAIPHRVGEAA